MTNPSHAAPSRRPEPIDLPPDVSALIDAAMARAAGRGAPRRPVLPCIRHSVRDSRSSVPRFALARRTRIPAPEDLALAGLLVAVIAACWISILVGLDVAKAAEGPTGLCAVRSHTAPGSPVRSAKLCDRLPQHW